MSDLIAFRRILKDARAAYADNRPEDALDLLIEALGLRRGACGEGLGLYGPRRDYFTTVDQEYIAAVAEAADASLVSRPAPRILPLLRQVAFGEPWNESLQARLILVLAATGQQEQALARYQAVRERLSDELGVDPGAEMRTAHSKVLRQEFLTAGQAISISSSPGTPSPLVPPAQLPADLPMFAGREWELSQLSAMLRPGSEFAGTVAVCVIDGMAGIGKTTCAIHWAHHVAKHFEDGQLYLNLRGFDSSDSATAPTDALGAFLHSLGVPPRHIPGDPDTRAALYRSVLAGKRILIVLDNARDVKQVRPLLPGSPGCLVIATSRNPLTGLAMTEGARLLTLHLPSVLTAKEILERRLGTGRVAAELEAVEKIIQLCGRLPLALAIVSARAAAHPDFTLASIATDLRRTQGRLDAFGAAGLDADARTVFSWSYHLLTPRACRLFRMLSLQPATDITAAASASLLGVPPEAASQLVAELANTSLITEHRPGRYSFHELTRSYAAELSESTDTNTERHEALARLLDHYGHSNFAAQVELKPHRGPIALETATAGLNPGAIL